MKLKTILLEIGDSFSKPDDVTFDDNNYIEFSLNNIRYCIVIGLAIDYQNKLAITISFNVIDDPKNFNDYNLTNQNTPLTLMGSIIWCLVAYLKKFHLNKELIYIKYDPKLETGKQINSRDKLYRILIQKFAKKNGSSVKFLERGGISAVFEPYILIK